MMPVAPPVEKWTNDGVFHQLDYRALRGQSIWHRLRWRKLHK